MSADEIVRELTEILDNVARTINLTNYNIKFDENAVRGDGFLGEFFYGAVQDKTTGKCTNVAIKKAFKSEKMRQMLNIEKAFLIEDHFYSRIFPALDKFQKEKKVSKPFDSIPKHYFSLTDPKKETIVMENIKLLGYEMHDKHKPLDKTQLKSIFQEYGKLHALSFAYRDQNSEAYEKLVDIYDFYEYLLYSEGFPQTVNSICKEIYEALEEKASHDKVLKAFKPYGEDAIDVMRKCTYKGKYKAILHGDCWSNNILFKYSDSRQIEKLCILDFQLARSGTPVSDLSYFFYSGGSKEDFDQLDYYLNIYHRSFCDFVKELGSDPDTLYPLTALKADWSKYSKFGIIMSLMLVKIKLMSKEKIADFTKSEDEDTFSKLEFDKVLFNKRGCDIVMHAYERNFL